MGTNKNLQDRIDAWFDKRKAGKQGFFYKNGSKLCHDVVGELLVEMESSGTLGPAEGAKAFGLTTDNETKE